MKPIMRMNKVQSPENFKKNYATALETSEFCFFGKILSLTKDQTMIC